MADPFTATAAGPTEAVKVRAADAADLSVDLQESWTPAEYKLTENSSGLGDDDVDSHGDVEEGDSADHESSKHTNLIVNYLPSDMKERELKAIFSLYGPVARCKVVVNRATNKSKGFGFVRMENPDDARRALSGVNRVEIRGKVLKVSFARPRSKARTGANLFVSNIPKVLTQEDLRHIFEAYGGVIECKILIDKATGKPRGAGFVRFSFRSEAQAAVDFLAEQAVTVTPTLAARYASLQMPVPQTFRLHVKFAEAGANRHDEALAEGVPTGGAVGGAGAAGMGPRGPMQMPMRMGMQPMHVGAMSVPFVMGASGAGSLAMQYPPPPSWLVEGSSPTTYGYPQLVILDPAQWSGIPVVAPAPTPAPSRPASFNNPPTPSTATGMTVVPATHTIPRSLVPGLPQPRGRAPS